MQKSIKQKYTSVFTLLMIIVFFRSALRSYSVGNDTESYLHIYSWVSEYNSLKDLLLSSLTLTVEHGYLAINWFCFKVFAHYQSILIISSIIIYWGFYRFIKGHSYSLLLSFAIFFFLGLSDNCMNIVRQCIATVIILYSYEFIIKQKKKKFFVAVIIACLFHRSAIIFLPAWWICNYTFNKKAVIITLFSSLGLLGLLRCGNSLLFSVMGDYANYMSDDYEYSAGGKIAPLINMIMYATIFVFCNKQIRAAESRGEPSYVVEDLKRMRNLLWVALCFLVLSLANALISRMAMYYYVFVLSLLPNAIRLSKKKGFWSLVIIFFLALYYLVTVYFKPEWNTVYPYSFFWENHFIDR